MVALIRLESCDVQWLGHHVSMLHLRPNVLNADLATLNQLPDEVKLHVDVLGAVAAYGIVREFDCSFVVLQDHSAVLVHAWRHE